MIASIGTKFRRRGFHLGMGCFVGFATVLVGLCLGLDGRIDGRGTDARAKHIRAFIPGTDHVPDVEVTDMATPNYWVSTTGDATAGASWSRGFVPGAGDVAIFTGKKSNCDCSFNLSGASDGPDEFIVRDDYYGDIGGPGNYYTHLSTNTVKFVLRGQGHYYLSPVATGGYTVVDTAQGYVSLYGPYLQCLDVKSGEVLIAKNSGFRQAARITLWGMGANVTIETSTTTNYPLRIAVLQGKLTNENELDRGANDDVDVFVASGVMRQEGLIDSATHIHIAGGIFEYAPNTSPSGQSPSFYVNGVLDVRDSEYAIPVSSLIIGPYGEIRGSAIETLNVKVNLDLRQDYP